MPRFHDPRLESEYRVKAPVRGCVSVIAWVAVARLVHIPTILVLNAHGVAGGRGLLLSAAISSVVSAIVVSIPLRIHFGRKKEKHIVSRSARAYQNRQKE